MLTALFDFHLPAELIALRPVEPRDNARLMIVYPDGRIAHRRFVDLEEYLESRDILSLNDSRVILARLSGKRLSRLPGMDDVSVEITLCRRLGPSRFMALAKPARRLRPGDVLQFPKALNGRVLSRTAGEVELDFDHDGDALDQAVSRNGTVPLPPYIATRRPPDDRDLGDYQTVYAAHDGSVAAPTAGLHFTQRMLARLQARNVGLSYLTLHVGAGTFLPVEAEETANHVMHPEQAILDAPTSARLNAAKAAGGRIVAVGTTALRALESAADESGRLSAFDSETSIFITPGYRFRAVDMLVTNFHLPRSTLFMLVCAFAGTECMKKAYAEAIRERYRFYSYGDACLLIRQP